jgi:hypothetical protein
LTIASEAAALSPAMASKSSSLFSTLAVQSSLCQAGDPRTLARPDDRPGI